MAKTMRKGFIQKLIRGVIDYHESERRRITTSTTRDEQGLRKKTIMILGRRKRYEYKTIGIALQTSNTSRMNAAILKISEALRQRRILSRKDKVSCTRALTKNIQRMNPILFFFNNFFFIFKNICIYYNNDDNNDNNKDDC